MLVKPQFICLTVIALLYAGAQHCSAKVARGWWVYNIINGRSCRASLRGSQGFIGKELYQTCRPNEPKLWAS